MMQNLSQTRKRLDDLQTKLKDTVNCLWAQQRALSLAYANGHQATDFLPRRLLERKKQTQLKIDRLLHHVEQIVRHEIKRSWFVIESEESLQTIVAIRTTLRYIQNAYAQEPLFIRHLAHCSDKFSISS